MVETTEEEIVVETAEVTVEVTVEAEMHTIEIPAPTFTAVTSLLT